LTVPELDTPDTVRLMTRTLAALAAFLCLWAPQAGASTPVVTEQPFALAFTDNGQTVFSEGRLAYRSLGVWHDARSATTSRDGDALVVSMETDAAPLRARITAVSGGVTRVEVEGPAGADGVRAGFATKPGERYLGFGERSDAVVRSGGTVENRVTEGPFQEVESPFIPVFVPLPGINDRPDATYFPLPWLLSSRGAGFLVRDDAHSLFRLGSPWRAEVDGARMTFEIFDGPTPAAALRRFTARVGRQPPAAAPFYFGPWWQPKGDAAAQLKTLRAAGAAGSLVQTYTHYLPCGDQQGAEPQQRDRTALFHAAGLAVTTYFNPMICTNYEPRYEQAVAAGALTRNPLGQPYVYRYQGSTAFLVSQFDFTQPAGRQLYGDLLDEAVGHGYDGWMEDFGEYTPDDARAGDGTSGAAAHNRYVVDYHAAAHAYATERAPRPLARFNRSGWTGAARESQIVWGGDPTTGWGFDGLRSALRNGLSMGLSGVSLWGSDIGGFFALSQPQTTPELLARWIELGFASGVMRTQANGFALRPSTRAQITDPAVLPIWTRYARLRTQLYPYLAAAERTYDRTGLPIMRALALAFPDDPRAVERDDEELFGPDLLVAPVLDPGATTRRLYLPRGRWIDWWRSVTLGADGAPRLHAPVVLEGGREVEVPAPLDELPMFVRARAVLSLLGADVETLSAYGKGSAVRLADRRGRRALVAWKGRVRVDQRRTRRLDIQLAIPKPCALRARGRRIRFRYRDGVVRARVGLRDGVIRAQTC
jgi:alpha-glucosidase (family GH31 glycosyl hydrolase)